jgi:hypothetical protein
VKRFIIPLLLCLTLASGPIGCSSTSTERRALQVTQTTTKVADAVLNAYAESAVLGKLTPAEEQRISALDADYRKAKAALRAAVVSYKSDPTKGDVLKASTAALQSIIASIISLPKAP